MKKLIALICFLGPAFAFAAGPLSEERAIIQCYRGNDVVFLDVIAAKHTMDCATHGYQNESTTHMLERTDKELKDILTKSLSSKSITVDSETMKRLLEGLNHVEPIH